ncbi:MAG: AAA family ATPase [Acidimicrobiia bacterium]|nr:AAA family ATPase [Acidimicrobiia bacterium]
MSGLEVRLLGGFELAREGRTLEQLPLRAARSLFAYLVLNRERPHTRDLLAGTFWPEFDESRARRRLSQALWQIKTTLGDEESERYLVGGTDTIRFNPDAEFSLDVDEFEKALAADDIARAVEIYRGDLLAGFYDDWLFPDQDRLRVRFLQALERLTEGDLARGDLEGGLIHARRIAAEDEFNEAAHRRVMRIAVLLGRHHEAIRQYEECRRILSEELGSRPSPETVALYEATLADRDSGGRAVAPHEDSPLFEDTSHAPFVGRDAERGQFAHRLDATLDGHGGVILIEGEAGVGKTRLLAEVVADARWRGMDVLWGRSHPSPGRPFGPLAEALDGISALRARQVSGRLDPAWRAVLAPLAPAIGGDAPAAEPVRRADEQARMREAITTAFRGVAGLVPTLVVLEDVHWADDDTIQALTQMVGQIGGDRLLFAVSYRHGEARERDDVWELLRSLDRLPHCSRLSLAPYSPAQTEELIRRSLGLSEVSGEFSERLHRETGGIPLFIVETLRALYERNDLASAELETEDAPANRDRLPLTPAVHALIRHRLEALEPASRDTIELISTHDGTLSLAEIESASELEPGVALQAVDDLVRRRFLSSSDGSFATGHELMRRVIYDNLTLSRRLDLHRRVARAVEQHRPDEVELLAHHFLTARMPERAAVYLERAASRAMAVHAYDTAVLHLERASAALDEIDGARERRFAVASLQEEVLDVLGRRDDQRHAVQRLERFATGPQRSVALTRKAWWLAHRDEFQQAVDTAREALALAEQEGDAGRTVSALTALGMIACFAGKATEGVEYLERAATFRGVDRSQEADARNALGQNLVDLQRFGEAESQLLAALAIYTDLDDARGQADVLGMLATLRMERGEPESAEKDYQRAIAVSRRIGYRHGEAVNQMNLGILFVITNQLGDALRMFDAAAETYGLMGNARGRALVQSNAAWMRHSRLGMDAEAEHELVEALHIYKAIGDERGIAQCTGVLASIQARRKDYEAAWAGFEAAIEMARRVLDQWLEAQMFRQFGVEKLIAGCPDEALEYATRAEQIATSIGLSDLLIGTQSLRGRAYLSLGRHADALLATTAAVERLHPGLELAHLVHYAHGLALHAAGRHADSHEQFCRAYEVLMQIVATLDPEDQQRAIRAVPDHASIIDWWMSERPIVRELVVASAVAPTGRPLASDELVPVSLTVSTPADLDIEDKVGRRQARLHRVLAEAAEQGASLTVTDLAAALDISEATVRRDLSHLRASGYPMTTRGSRAV